MFYCDKCAEENNWPTTMFKSRGRCEMCEASAECNDRPSSLLPIKSDIKFSDPLNFGDKVYDQEKRSGCVVAVEAMSSCLVNTVQLTDKR